MEFIEGVNMRRKIEIDDTMDENIDCVKEELFNRTKDYLKENLDISDVDEVYQNIADDVHEIVDSSTPIYYSEIDALFYLYGDEVEEAYKNAGCYTEPPENFRQVCIYFYLEEKAWDYWREDIVPLIEEYIEYKDKISDKEEIDIALISWINKHFVQ